MGTRVKPVLTLDEKFAIGHKALELKKQGKLDEYERVFKQIPLPPYLAKFYKDHLGLDALKKTGWNLSEAEVEFGSDWLVK
jgi:hypothetical protein